MQLLGGATHEVHSAAEGTAEQDGGVGATVPAWTGAATGKVEDPQSSG